jgi:SAM-dependent methyltransferase
MDRQEHWDRAYRAKGPQGVSWFQERPDVSLALIAQSGIDKAAGVIDVGGGASTLVDHLLSAGYQHLAVLDVSAVALAEARTRLGARATDVQLIAQDVTTFRPARRFGLWHDRAVFHFLTAPQDRRLYVQSMRHALEPGGTAIMATFALDGPPKCSGLEVVRYDESAMMAEVGSEFVLQDVRRENHKTPWGAEQRFVYFLLRCSSPSLGDV